MWFQRLDRILEELRSLPCSLLDRHAIEKLFGVGERRARQLMENLPAMRFGNAIAVDRGALMARLEGLERSDEYTRERNRKLRVVDHLDQLRKHLAARSIRVPAARDAHSRTLDNLSRAIEIGPGELRVKFDGAEDLTVKLFELSQVMANDWESFCARVEKNITSLTGSRRV